MNNINFSLVDRVVYNGSDVHNLYINGQLMWLKYFNTYYYLGQTLYKNGERFDITSLSRAKITGVNAVGATVDVNIATEIDNVTRSAPTNTSGYEFGQTIFVDDKQAVVTGVDGNDITYTFLDGSTQTQDATSTTNITIGGGSEAPGETTASTDTWETGDTVYVNGRAAEVKGETDDEIFIQYTDTGGFATIPKSNEGESLSTEQPQQDYNIGDTIYINGREATVTGIAGDVVTYSFVDDSTTGSSDVTTEDGTTSANPNTSGYDIGDDIYIDGASGTVTGISGTGVQYTLVDGTTGVVNNTSTSTSASSSPNTTGYDVGDIFYIGGVLHEVTAVSGGNLSTVDYYGTETTFDPTTQTIENEAPNYTNFTLGQTLYVSGASKIVYKIEGYIITFTDGTVSDTSTATNVSPYAPNTTSYTVGQTLYVSGVAKTIDFFDANKIYFTDSTMLVDGDSTISTTATQVDGVNIQAGDQVYDGTSLKTISSIEGTTINYTDGTSSTNTSDINQANDPPNYTAYSVGDDIYVNLSLRTIQSILGTDITFTDGTNVDAVDNTTSPTPPNYTVYTVGQAVYVDTSLKTISFILGHVLTFTDGTDIDSNGADNIYVSKPNFTAYSIGDELYVDLTLKTIQDIIGHGITFTDGTNVDASTATNLSVSAPNYTGHSVGQTLYINGGAAIIGSILGYEVTFQNGTAVTLPKNYITDEAPVLYGNAAARIQAGHQVGIENKADNTEHLCQISAIYNDGTMMVNPNVGGTNIISWTSTTNHIVRKLAPNTSSYSNGQTIYINGVEKIIEYISENWIVTQDNVEIDASDVSISTQPNTSTFEVGDDIFISTNPGGSNPVVDDAHSASKVTAVAGSVVYYEPKHGTSGSYDKDDPANVGIDSTLVPISKEAKIYITKNLPSAWPDAYISYGAEWWNWDLETEEYVWSSLTNTLQAIGAPWTGEDTVDGNVGSITISGKKANGDPHFNAAIFWRYTMRAPWNIDTYDGVEIYLNGVKSIITFVDDQWKDTGITGLQARGQIAGQRASILFKPSINTPNFTLELRPTLYNAVEETYVGGQYKTSGYYADKHGSPQKAWRIVQPLSLRVGTAERLHVLTGNITGSRQASLRGQHYIDESFNVSHHYSYDQTKTTVDLSPDGQHIGVTHVQRDTPGNYVTQHATTNQSYFKEDNEGQEFTNIALCNHYAGTSKNMVTSFYYYDEKLYVNTHNFTWAINAHYGGDMVQTVVWDREVDNPEVPNQNPSPYIGVDYQGIACSDDGTKVVFCTSNGILCWEGDPNNLSAGYTLTNHITEYLDTSGTNIGFGNAYKKIAMSGDGSTFVVGNSLGHQASTSQGQTIRGSARCWRWDGSGYTSHQSDIVGHPNDGMQNKVSYYFGYAVTINHDGTRIAVGSHMAQIDVGGVWVFDRNYDTTTGTASYTKYWNKYGTYGDENFGSAVELSADGHFLVIGALENELATGQGSYFGRVMFWEDTLNNSFTQRFEKRPDSNHVWRLGRKHHVQLDKTGNVMTVNQVRFPRYVSQAEADKGEFTTEDGGHILMGRVDIWHANMANVTEHVPNDVIALTTGQHVIVYNETELANKNRPPLCITTN
jgi:hypothetical protein